MGPLGLESTGFRIRRSLPVERGLKARLERVEK